MKVTLSLFISFIFLIARAVSQDFVINDVLVSAPDTHIGDIELDPYHNRLCWQSTNDHKLWVCHLDTIDWALTDPYGMETLVDTALTPLNQTNNGGEWGFNQTNSLIVYNKLIKNPISTLSAKIRYVAIATETSSGWLVHTLIDAPHRINPHATRNQEDTVVAIHYIRSSYSINTKYKFLNDPCTEHAIICFTDAHWAENEQLLTGIIHDDQVGLFDPWNPGPPVQLTNDPVLIDYSLPFMWRAPEHMNARMFFARANGNEIRVFKETSPNTNNYTLYLSFQSPSSNPAYDKITSPEPIVYQGQSYITFMVSSSPYETSYLPSEIWIAKVDSLEPVYRMVSDTTVAIRTDPEPFPTTDMLLTYYTELIDPLNPEGTSRIHKCETGFGLEVQTGFGENDHPTDSEYLIYPNPFLNRISLKRLTGKERLILTDQVGQIVWSGKQIEKKDFSDLASGFYFLKIISGGAVQTKKLLKE